MLVQAFPSGPFETNAYVVACLNTKKAIIIDPAPGSFQIIASYLEKNHFLPEKIVLTHSHWDHIADAASLKKKYQIPVYIHQEDAPNLEKPGTDGLPCWITIEGTTPDLFLQEGDIVEAGSIQLKVIETPGHTPGGICLYSEKEHILFSGDTLFKGTIGNLSFPTARKALMWPSLDKLAKLPFQTKVYSGHGSPTTIGAESWLPRAKQLFEND